MDTYHEEIIVGPDDSPRESRPRRSRQWDAKVEDDVLAAWQRQQEEIDDLAKRAMSEYAKGNFDAGNALARKREQLQRGEVVTDSLQTRTVSMPQEDHIEGTLSKAVSAEPGPMERVRREVSQKLNNTNLPSDPNIRTAPQIYRRGYTTALKEVLVLLDAEPE